MDKKAQFRTIIVLILIVVSVILILIAISAWWTGLQAKVQQPEIDVLTKLPTLLKGKL